MFELHRAKYPSSLVLTAMGVFSAAITYAQSSPFPVFSIATETASDGRVYQGFEYTALNSAGSKTSNFEIFSTNSADSVIAGNLVTETDAAGSIIQSFKTMPYTLNGTSSSSTGTPLLSVTAGTSSPSIVSTGATTSSRVSSRASLSSLGTGISNGGSSSVAAGSNSTLAVSPTIGTGTGIVSIASSSSASPAIPTTSFPSSTTSEPVSDTPSTSNPVSNPTTQGSESPSSIAIIATTPVVKGTTSGYELIFTNSNGQTESTFELTLGPIIPSETPTSSILGGITIPPQTTTESGPFSTITTEIPGLTTHSVTTTKLDGSSGPTVLPIWWCGLGGCPGGSGGGGHSGIIIFPLTGPPGGGVIPPPDGFPEIDIDTDGQPEVKSDSNPSTKPTDDGTTQSTEDGITQQTTQSSTATTFSTITTSGGNTTTSFGTTATTGTSGVTEYTLPTQVHELYSMDIADLDQIAADIASMQSAGGNSTEPPSTTAPVTSTVPPSTSTAAPTSSPPPSTSVAPSTSLPPTTSFPPSSPTEAPTPTITPAPSGTLSCGSDSAPIATSSVSALISAFCSGDATYDPGAPTIDSSHPEADNHDIPDLEDDKQVYNNIYATLATGRAGCASATFDLSARSALCSGYFASITASCSKAGGMLTSAGCFDWGVKAFTAGSGEGKWS
ncbi:MAG: hypothetical protein HETSPECPRED_002806 [Heterodermia speciosa]|uniref:Uncharacterized protein n=1 Tax=Heterodermia speciosa TaxID=116794 RepID=A0A8H3EZ77_9LECA|nr:MAG: hypothetical protein HETSPECPRED_002806 [Heterodermia speciosa]